MAEEVKTAAAEGESGSKNFIDAFIEEDIAEGGRFQGQQVHTRFPPEPNGYLHIGHCKALTIDFGTAERFGGLCNLRMDDTNPTKEDVEFVDAIKEDIHWLGFDWGDRFFYGSDYFEKDYEYAVELIKKGLAYVCDLTPEQAREYRGDIGKPAISPYRDRDVEENLDLFERMKNGEFPEGSRTLRAKIDLASGNFNMRDPVLYRIRYIEHHRQGTKWCIFPMYDFAHPIQDALEGITHSLCSLEYEDHRPLYDWVVNNVSVPCKPRQIEFSRLGINYTVMSKRKLRRLVEEGYVSGWDDPRMPTLTGLRNRGIPAQALKNFCEEIGVAKANSEIEVGYFEHFARDYLNKEAPRAMAVFNPIKVVIDNLEGEEDAEIDVNPNKVELGKRKMTFSNEIYIDAEDFSVCPPPKYFRMKVGGLVRLKGAYVVKCDSYEADEDGNVKLVHCSVLPGTKSGEAGSDIKVKGTIQWVDAKNAVPVEVRQYEYLLKDAEYPGQDFSERMNEHSLTVLQGFAEKYIEEAKDGESFQLLRKGYYKKMVENGKIILSEIVSLKDSFKM